MRQIYDKLSVLTIVSNLINERKRQYIAPSFALYTDILRVAQKEYGMCKDEVNNELRSLLERKRIKVGRTMNDNYIIVL